MSKRIVRRWRANALFPFAMAALTSAALGSGCFIDNPGLDPTSTSTSSGSGGGGGAGGADASDAGDAGDAGPALCVKYGGYSTVEKVVGDIVGALVTDCRISEFFTTLSMKQQAHLGDCLTKQIAVLMGCPGIRYDVDNAGAMCRDMKSSHEHLAIRADDFDALIEDVVTVLKTDGVSQDDIDAMAPALLFLKTDIVTNSAPGTSKPVCHGGKP